MGVVILLLPYYEVYMQKEKYLRTLTDQQFLGFEEHIKDSTNRMLHNFIVMFLFAGVYEKSDKETKQHILNFVTVIKEDILKVHITKAETAFDLTDRQKEILNNDINIILTNCLAPIFNLVKKEQTNE